MPVDELELELVEEFEPEVVLVAAVAGLLVADVSVGVALGLAAAESPDLELTDFAVFERESVR